MNINEFIGLIRFKRNISFRIDSLEEFKEISILINILEDMDMVKKRSNINKRVGDIIFDPYKDESRIHHNIPCYVSLIMNRDEILTGHQGVNTKMDDPLNIDSWPSESYHAIYKKAKRLKDYIDISKYPQYFI